MRPQQKQVEPLSVMARDAVRIAAGWLRKRLPDRLGPSDPEFDAQQQRWRVPIVLSYPVMNLGEVGELWIDANSGEVIAHTDLTEVEARALQLGRKNRAKVRAAFLQARNR